MDVGNLISGSSAFLKPAWTSGSSWFMYCWSLAWRILSIILLACAAAAAKSLQSCPTLCDPIDSSPPGSPVPGILQAITLEWVAIAFSNAWKWKVKVKSLSYVRLCATPWTAAHQASLPITTKILKDDAVKVLHSICQQIWKTQQWPQDWKRSVSFQSQRKAMPKNAQTTA